MARHSLPSRIRLSSTSAAPPRVERRATLHTEASAEHADVNGLSSPVISLAAIRRLEIGRISLSDVVGYTRPEGVQATGVHGGASEDHIHIASHHLPAVQNGATGVGSLFRRKQDASAPRRTGRRRAASAQFFERPIVSAYLSTVHQEMGPKKPASSGGPEARLRERETETSTRQQRVDQHNSWLLRKEGERGNTWKILELLQAGVLVDGRDEEGRTACHLAAMNDHSKAIMALANPHQDSYTPHNFEDATHDGATALHYAAFNGCSAAAKTILKMHRANIQAGRFKIRDADAHRLADNRSELHQNETQLAALRARIEELDEKEFELTSQVAVLNEQTAGEDSRHEQEHDRVRYNQKEAEEKLETHAEQCAKLEQMVAHWKPISRVKYEAYNAEWETSKIEMSQLELALIEAVSLVEKEGKAHGKTMRKLSRQHLQATQSLQTTQEMLQEKNSLEAEMSQLNGQLLDENRRLRLSVTDLSRKVVHVCKGAHHIEFNANIYATAADGSTPLHWAADSGHDDMCHALLACGADANAVDAQGLSPLHWCAIARPHQSSIPQPKLGGNYLKCSFELLACGAKCNLVDKLGNSPLHYAASSGFTQLIEVVKEWGGDASIQNTTGANALHYAMAAKPPHFDAALALVASIKDIYSIIHIQDTHGMSPIHYANANGYEEMAAELVLHCNELQLQHSQEAMRQARMGMRDAKHKHMSQLVGAHVTTGSMAEHTHYYHDTLVATRTKGWTRNDLIHQVKPRASSTKSLHPHHLFESLSSTLTSIAAQDDADMLALSVLQRSPGK